MLKIPAIKLEMQKKIAKVLECESDKIAIFISNNKHLIKIFLPKSNNKFENVLSYITETYQCGNKKIVLRLYLDYQGYEYSKIVEILEDILENLMADYFVALED